MTATATEISQVRRMTNELTNATYSDDQIQAYIEAHPLVDADGYSPDQDSWTATYDLNAAAADIWEEKAAKRADHFDFTADGGSYQRSQSFNMCMQQARYFRSKRSLKTIEMESTPKEDEDLTDSEEV